MAGDLTEVGGVGVVAGRVDSAAILAAEEGDGMGKEEGSRPILPGLEEDGESGSIGVEEIVKKKM